ncbi:YcjF family protein [Geminocystis herdmanii]|uniref:YcjF family protein n=1 Tax=Geminocystis herdmanii TaxID=669359 RepID=UPI0003467DC9|nr:GTPase [Geminocystis herdmanii]
MKFPSIKNTAQKTLDLFKVDESQIAELLESVRSNLPTTEALLIGKPQAGKSSIVRGLTGVGSDIIGQGFRPHTQFTKRYAYPSEELPLLIFTDTVGLGDVNKNTEQIIQELTTELDIETKRARILILTIKITDFATDSLKIIAQNLRKKYPQIPCLLVVTSLHELYPDLTLTQHPNYPPDFAEINRAFEEIKNTFKGLFDRAILIDFTLEEDGFNPVFYGLENLRDSLAELLPSAEAKTIHQLLDETVNSELGNLYKDVARRYILAFCIMAGTVSAVPLPFATMPVLTALEVTMVGMLGQLYGQTITASQAGGIISAIAGGFLAQAIGRELIKFVPGFGSVVAASWAATYTWGLGEGACAYFGDIIGGKKPNPEKIKQVMKNAFENAKEQLKIEN